MAKQGKSKKSKVDLIPRELATHIKVLNLRSVGEYQQWCKNNEFSISLNKDSKRRYRELDFHNKNISIGKLKNHSKTKKQATTIEKIYLNEIKYNISWDKATNEIHSAFSSSKNKKVLFNTLMHLEACSKLTKYAEHIKCIASAVTHSHEWKRSIKEWAPKTHNVNRQFSSLIRHLFSDYYIPEFMDSIWLSNQKKEHRWFIHLGSGKNIRTADKLPVSLTKKMAHHFLSAPNHYTVKAAFRWAQIIALGGSKRIADAINETRIVRNFKDDDFWLSVIRFFIDNPMLDCVHINPIIDFIWDQKYEDRIVFVERGVAESMGPEQPNFSMKGRTAETLLRQVNAWHRSLGRETRGSKLQWEKSKINDFEFIEGNKQKKNVKIWRIHELLSSQELIAEGRTLGHCVASYASSCKHGKSTICTVACEDITGSKKLLTIEVLLSSKRICQVRGKHNRLPTEQEKKIVQRWAQQEQLQYISSQE